MERMFGSPVPATAPPDEIGGVERLVDPGRGKGALSTPVRERRITVGQTDVAASPNDLGDIRRF